MHQEQFRPFIEPNYFVDSDHPEVVAFTREHSDPEASPVDNAVRLYNAVRDGFRYNPYRVVLTREAFKASNILTRGPEAKGHCIDKANLLVAACRSLGIPTRLHFANVRNHIATEKLEQILGTDLLVFHGYAGLYLEEQWVSATPAFDAGLCRFLKVAPLEFNGREDSIFQQYDRDHRRFMEYVEDHGSFAEIPFEMMIAAWKEHYPKIRELGQWPSLNLEESG